MTTYFTESVIKSLGTRKANKKNKQKTAAEVTQQVKQQAAVEARQQAESDVTGALQNLLDSKKSSI